MLKSIGSILGIFIQIVTLFVFMKKLFNIDIKKDKLRNFLCFIGFNIFTISIYNVEYGGIETMIFFITIILVLFTIYKFTISKAFIAAGLFMISLFFSDIVSYLIFINVGNLAELRSNLFVYTNLVIGIITVSLVSIPKIKRLFLEIIRITTEKKNSEIIVFVILLLCALTIITYMVSQNFLLNGNFMLNVTGMLIFIMLALIFLKEYYEKEKIVNKYDQMFEYVESFEEWMDIENMNIHESKNQLVTLRDMVKSNKKAVGYIDNIINERISIETNSNEKLKYIPKGGLKGLLYYKISIAEKNKINLLIDVSKKAEHKLKKLSIDETKMLCRLMGIFFDNAIYAAAETIKKRISFEVYESNEELNIIISNTYANDIFLNKLGENGYTTKEEGRGKGLYLAKKFSSKYKIFELENRIINDYYIQKIKIKV